MNYANMFLALMLFSFVSCAMMNQNNNNEVATLQGQWVSVNDNNWKITFKENRLTEVYGDEVIEQCMFSVSKESCDKNYSTLEATFLKYACKEDVCFEITELSDTSLTYRETTTGKLNSFKKNK